MPLFSGDKIESYELVQKCGRGSFGEVWIALDPLNRRVALKIIDKYSRAKDELKGLMTYFKMPSNPNLISIYHIGETKEFYYYTMELADNASKNPNEYIALTLETALQQNGAFSVRKTIEIGNKLLQGISVLHKAGVVHRDLKPSNIIFINGEPKISDIGLIFQANIPATLIGSIGFITPERISSYGKIAYTAADDLYALGKILYCLWTGNPPEDYPSLPAKCFATPQDASLNALIKRACSINPQKRFQQDNLFSDVLNTPLEAAGTPPEGQNGASGTPPGTPGKNIFRRKRWRNGIFLTLALLLLVALFQYHRNFLASQVHRCDYLVIDLSSGPNSTKYPVRWSAVPPDLTDDTCRTNELWLKRIPAGSFLMGSPESEPGHRSNEHLHKVDIQHDFYMGIFEVTQMQFCNVMGTHGSRAMGDTRPIEWVDYQTLRKSPWGWPLDNHVLTGNSFLTRLQQRTGLRFDLPTEAEWEYAYRAGTSGPLYLGGEDNAQMTTMVANLSKIARYDGNRREHQPGGFREHTRVGSYLPNAWGLYDMQGNVWEFCLDWYEDKPEAQPKKTPKGPLSSTTGERVIRGGDWLSTALECRAALRRGTKPSISHSTGGFRIAYPSDLPDIEL